jgi:hypothetical protein
LADDDILDLAKPVGKGLPPAVVVGPVGVLSRKLLAARDILEIAALFDDGSTSVRVAQIPGFVELPDNLFGRMHQDAFLRGEERVAVASW